MTAHAVHRTGGIAPHVLTAAGAVGVGLLAVLHEAYAAEVAVACLVLACLLRLELRHAIVALLAYLPFEELVLTHVPTQHVAAARYGPELLVDAFVLAILLAKFDLVLARLGKGLVPFALLVSVWISSGIWNSIGLRTELIGFRSEFRLLPLLVIPLASKTPLRDARLYGRVFVWLGVLESAIAGLEFVSGPALRSWFAPQWDIVLGGVSVSTSAPPDLNSVFGTFSQYNELGIFLVLAWITLAAGAEQLGFSKRFGLIGGCMIAGAIAISGSRESAVALVLSAIIIGRVRKRLPVLTIGALVLVTAALLIPAVVSTMNVPNVQQSYSSTSLPQRWKSLLSPALWKTDQNSNFRLFLLRSNVQLVAKSSPGFGYGIGSVSDRSKLANGTSPIYRTAAGVRAGTFSYVYDGNWGLVLLEVGFIGLAALGLLFAYLIRVGASLLRVHWSGLALITTVAVTVMLGFFAPILQLRAPGAFIWLLTGVALACRAERVGAQDMAQATDLPRPAIASPKHAV